MKAPLPKREQERLDSLQTYEVLDTLPEQAYDDIVFLASQITDTPIALVSLVDENRQWFKSRVGLDVTETDRDLAFCAHAILNPNETLIVNDATRDERFSDNPLVLGDPEIRFYAGAPLTTADGLSLGTLCVIDRTPRELAPKQIAALQALSRQVMAQLELRRVVDKLLESNTALETHRERLEKYQKRLEEANEHLTTDSATDALTGLMNRRAFDSALDREYDRAKRYGESFSLMLLDVDKFKEYNDTYGHPAGDDALKQTAEILSEQARKSDIVCRYGGEEFACLLANADEDTAFVVAERMRIAFVKHNWALRSVTISIGLAGLEKDVQGRSDIVAQADQALYAAKKAGRNRTVSASSLRDK